MLFEHLIYSTAIAIIAGMVWYKYTGRDPSWIIIASAYAPDFDIFAGELFKKFDMNILINGAPIRHGDFHNIAFLLLFACAAALVLKLAGMRFGDSFLFADIGGGRWFLAKDVCLVMDITLSGRWQSRGGGSG